MMDLSGVGIVTRQLFSERRRQARYKFKGLYYNYYYMDGQIFFAVDDT